MINNNFLDLVTKLLSGMLTPAKKQDENTQKSAYKPINSNFAATGGQKTDRSDGEKGTICPKQSLVEMLRRHDALSKKIDGENYPQS